MPRRRKRRRGGNAKVRPQPLDEEHDHAERQQQQLSAAPVESHILPIKLDRRVTRTFAAADRAIASSTTVPPRAPGIRAWFTGWRERRRKRLRLAACEKAMAGWDPQRDVHASTALLALVTERVALMSDAAEIEPTIAQVERIIADYTQYQARVDAAYAGVRARSTRLREMVAISTSDGDAQLAAECEQQLAVTEARAHEAAETLRLLAVGRRRLEDAIASLQALARRSAALR